MIFLFLNPLALPKPNELVLIAEHYPCLIRIWMFELKCLIFLILFPLNFTRQVNHSLMWTFFSGHEAALNEPVCDRFQKLMPLSLLSWMLIRTRVRVRTWWLRLIIPSRQENGTSDWPGTIYSCDWLQSCKVMTRMSQNCHTLLRIYIFFSMAILAFVEECR